MGSYCESGVDGNDGGETTRPDDITIVMDHRERRSGIHELLAGRSGIRLEVESLGAGDYRIANSVTIERKSAHDFVLSVIDGRLFRQAGRLKNNSERPMVLVEGNPFKTDFDMRATAIRGAIISLQAIWYLPVIHTRSIEETADLLVMMGCQCEKHECLFNRRAGYRPKRLASRQRYFLQGLPDIGPILADRLLTHFGTLRNVINATRADLIEIEGLGPKTAETIIHLLDHLN